VDDYTLAVSRAFPQYFHLVRERLRMCNSQLIKDTFQTLATQDSFGPTGARLMSTHLLEG
jgi:hypothetical protein